MSKLFEMIREDIYHIKVLDRELLEYPLFEFSVRDFGGINSIVSQDSADKKFDRVKRLFAGEGSYRIFDKMCFIYDNVYGDNKDYDDRELIDGIIKETCVFIDFVEKKVVVTGRYEHRVEGKDGSISINDIILINKVDRLSEFDPIEIDSFVYMKSKGRPDLEIKDKDNDIGITSLLQSFALISFVIDKINSCRDIFIMEEAVAGRRFKPKNKNKYENKTKYRIIKPVDFVRKYLKRDDVEGTKKCDHFRRGHWRTFRSDRYKNVQGDRTWIDAVWIGESEATMKNVRYKIRLDL